MNPCGLTKKQEEKSLIEYQKAAQALGSLGGKARAAKLSKAHLHEIAVKGGKAFAEKMKQKGKQNDLSSCRY